MKQIEVAKDNAISALGKFLEFYKGADGWEQLLNYWLNQMPIQGDKDEAK